MFKGFWHNLKKPIIGLAPMDGVTDAACRYVMDMYGHPDILFTEFTSVEGIVHGAERLLDAFIYHKTKTPTVAQIFGTDPKAFYKVAIILGEMGFNGIDINMGCPDPNISKRGGGAGLILQPKLAQEIVRKTRQGIEDWADGKKYTDLDLRPKVVQYIKTFRDTMGIEYHMQPDYDALPVSVKTRIGFQDIVTKDWIQNLLEVEPANITLHGRTLKQLYSGEANWEEIGKAAELAHKTSTTLLGNGDIKSLTDAYTKIKTYGTDGVLIGRATWGNPWFFQNKNPTIAERFQVALDHAKAFANLLPKGHYLTMRKHLAWYCKGFENASDIRAKLTRVNNAEDVADIINSIDLEKLST